MWWPTTLVLKLKCHCRCPTGNGISSEIVARTMMVDHPATTTCTLGGFTHRLRLVARCESAKVGVVGCVRWSGMCCCVSVGLQITPGMFGNIQYCQHYWRPLLAIERGDTSAER